MLQGKKIALIFTGVCSLIVIGFVGFAARFYYDLSQSLDATYHSDRKTKLNARFIDFTKEQPFSILLMGIDTGDLGRGEQGRSDTMMVAAVNSRRNHTLLTSIPRDTYAEIAGRNTQEKINHAYAYGGPIMASNTVQNYLDVPIDHYISINMAGLKDLVAALGEIEVNNPLSFKQDGYQFNIGRTLMDANQTLAYSRMRYDDPEGDYGRQERQRKVIEGIIKKLGSLDGLRNYQRVLKAVEKNMQTDLSFEEMQTIAFHYRKALDNVQQDQLKGQEFMQENISYQRVSETELSRVQVKLKKQLNILN